MVGLEDMSGKWDKLNKELDDALEEEFGLEEPNQESVFEEAKSTLRKHLFDNKAKVARDLEQMREWSNANKQETLVEVAEEFYSEQSKAYEDGIEPMFDTSRYLVAGFIEGAKWQQERMYSEEEVLELLSDYGYDLVNADTVFEGSPMQWFQQFKKK